MFRKFLNPDNALMITMTQLTDCIFLSLFWLVGCIPVITLGASFAALYDATFRGFRQGDKHCWGRFWQVYRDNWKSAAAPTAVFAVCFLVPARALIALWNAAVAGGVSWMLFSGGAFVGMLLLGILSILFPMVSRFENSLPRLLKNTLLLGFAHLPRTLVLGMLNAATIWLCLRYIFPLFFLPSLSALLGSLLIEPMFRPYQPSEDAA